MRSLKSKQNGHGNSVATPTQRANAIRGIVQEMNRLLMEKNRTRDRIRQLTARAKVELGFAPGDFVMGVRLANMAARREQKTLNTVREVLSALGNVIPTIAQPAASTLTLPPIKARVYDLVAKHGPTTAAQLKKLDPALSASMHAHLAQLKAAGKVHHEADHTGSGIWSVK